MISNDFLLQGMLVSFSNSLVLFSHTQFGKMIFTKIMNKLYPEVEIENKDITGKYSFEFQKKSKKNWKICQKYTANGFLFK